MEGIEYANLFVTKASVHMEDIDHVNLFVII